MGEVKNWRCFHCDEVFYDEHSAKLHFGMDQCSDPACKIKMGAEGSLVNALRKAEAELADAWLAIHNESTEAAKAYYAQQSRHGEQLRAAEELGYERGLADGRKYSEPFLEALKQIAGESGQFGLPWPETHVDYAPFAVVTARAALRAARAESLPLSTEGEEGR